MTEAKGKQTTGGGGSSSERKVGVPEAKTKEQLLETAKDKGRREKLINNWKGSLEKTKDGFKRKLVGGKKEHKEKLDEIIRESKEKLRKIEGLPEDRKEQALEKLEKDSQGKIDELVNKVDKDIEKTSDKKMQQLAEGENQTKLIWDKWREAEDTRRDFEKELKGRSPDRDRLLYWQNQLTDKQAELAEMIEEMDYKGPIQIREYYEQEIGRKINRLKIEMGLSPEARNVDDKVELFKARAAMVHRETTPEKAAELISEIKRLEKEKLVSTETAGRLEDEVKQAVSRAEKVRGDNLAEELRRRASESKVEVTKEKLEQVKKLSPKGREIVEKIVDEDLRKVARLSEEGLNKLWEKISSDEIEDVDDLVRGLEKDPGGIDDVIETIDFAREIGGGKYSGFLKQFEIWARANESQLRPEKMLEDAKREIVETALERINRFGDKTEFAVTNEDVKTWVLEQMNKVIAGGEEATGYAARQYLMEVAGILEKKDLKFKEIIGEMAREVDKDGKIEMPYRGLRMELGKQEVIDLDRLFKGEHVVAAKEDFKEEISAAIIVYELGNAYSRSSGPEDMVRISAAARTEHLDWVLNMKSVGRDVRGRLKFYEIEMYKETNKKRVLSRGDWNDKALGEDEVKAMHTGEVNLGGLDLVVMKDGKEIEVIKSDEFKSLLQIAQEDVEITTGDVLDILNQERFAVATLSRQSNIASKMRREVVREAIMKNMGVVDIDGGLNRERLNKLLEQRHGKGEYNFKLKNAKGDDLTDKLYKVRAKMVMEEVGEKEMEHIGGKERQITLINEETGEKTRMWIGGIYEDGDSLDGMFNEYKMMFKLGEGMWKFMGLAPAHWDKEFNGDVKDWHSKVLHFPRYCHMYGVGPAHFREHVKTDYGDFVTQRLKDIVPELFEEHIYLGLSKSAKDARWHRKELMNLLVRDNDRMFMSRQRLLDIYGRFIQLGGGGEGWLREMLEKKAQYRFGKIKGLRLVNEHWSDMKKINWSPVIKEGIDGGKGVSADKMKGFDGFYWYIKKNYKYANLKWGRGGHKDVIWAQRLYKEAQYLLQAEKYRGAFLGWLTGEVDSPNKMIEALGMPGWYGMSDVNRKSQLLLRKWREYFGRVGGGLNPLITLETIKVHPHTNLSEGLKSDPWDGSGTYDIEKVGVNTCLSKRERGIGPYITSQMEEVVDQFFRAGKLGPRYYNEMKNELVFEGGEAANRIHYGLEKVLGPELSWLLKVPLWPLIGGINIPEIKIGNVVLVKDWDPSGIIGWVWKIMKKWLSDTWAVRKEIWQGTKKALGEQVGSVFKQE